MGSQQMISAAAAVVPAASGDRAVRTSFAHPLRRAVDAFILGEMRHQATEKLRRISSDLRSFLGR
jgi:putative NIF3 family GTP cyclohydrolase 1 type 2